MLLGLFFPCESSSSVESTVDRALGALDALDLRESAPEALEAARGLGGSSSLLLAWRLESALESAAPFPFFRWKEPVCTRFLACRIGGDKAAPPEEVGTCGIPLDLA
jgi:hypothetical protein